MYNYLTNIYIDKFNTEHYKMKILQMKKHYFLKPEIVLLLIAILVSVQSFSQSNITGTVFDADLNEPAIGVNILIKGKSIGTITNIDGQYSLQALPTDILVFSYIGMQSQEIKVGNQTKIDVKLTTESKVLQEFVAIGYVSVKKSDLTGSVSVISTKDLTRNPSPSAAQALQGKATGVLVSSSGAPGGDANIRVRGVGSLSSNPNPIYIVDGVQIGSISGIQPDEIESLQVLKDASATAVYGANGSNGVIIITTKRGKDGKVAVNLNSYVTMNFAPDQYDVMNAQQYSDFYAATKYKLNGLDKTFNNQTNKAYALSPEFRQLYYGDGWEKGTNWQDYVYKNSLNQNYNISISGGAENSNFSVSLGYTGEDGTIIKNTSERFRIRANSDFRINKFIKIGENLSVNRSISEDPITVQSSLYDLTISPLMKVYNAGLKGGYESFQNQFLVDGRTYSSTLDNDKPNVIAAPMLGSFKSYGIGTNASVYLQIDFDKYLMFKVTPAVEMVSTKSKRWLPNFEGNRTNGDATLKETYGESTIFNMENQLLYKRTFNKIHNVQATAVHSFRSQHNTAINGEKKKFPREFLNTLSNATTINSLGGSESDYRMLSYLSRVLYDYKGKYYATASYRSDGVSVFDPENRRGHFFSGSLAWRVTEDFLKNQEWLDNMKIRLGWGQTGNSSIGGGFQYVDQVSEMIWFSPVFGENQTIATAQYAYQTVASKNIHWEAAEMLNIGVDMSVFKSKLNASIEYYIKNNNDLLVKIPVTLALGHLPGKSGQPWANAGKIQNKGIEVSLQWKDKIGKINYGISTNVTTIKNTVNYIPVPNIIPNSGYNITLEGHSIGTLYGYVDNGIIQLTDEFYMRDGAGKFTKDGAGNYTGYKFANQEGVNPQPGDLKYADLNADGIVDASDRTIIGKTIPSLNYTFSFDISYKNFDFNLFLNGVNDFDIYNLQRAQLSTMSSGDANKLVEYATNYWSETNPSTTHVRVDLSNKNKNDQISTFWIEDGSFLRIKDIQIGYNLESKVCKYLNINSLRLYANASNLYNFTKYKGKDPESFMSSTPLESGIDYGSYVTPRSVTFGIQIGL